MARYTISEYTEEAKLMLAENEERLKKIFGTHDQYTGKGMEGHTHKVRIEGYPIREQWLTEEVYRNPLYQAVIKSGSIEAYTQAFNEENNTSITGEDLIDRLYITRCSRDPSFAFYTAFKIKPKEGGDMIPFRLNYAQI